MKSKQELRSYAKNIRKSLDMNLISNQIISKIKNLSEYKNAKNVMLFYPLKNEINLLALLDDNKNFYLPKVKEDNLVVCSYSQDLEISELNIFEPCTEPVNPQILDIIFVPALMADFEGYRLGYGKGFYDRFLGENPNIKTVVPIPRELLIEHLPQDKFDVKVWKILTQ